MNKIEKLHRDNVSECGCVVCFNLGYGWRPAEIHHIRKGAGAGRKSDEFRILPLCDGHHRTGGYGKAYHAGRLVWEANFGTELELLSQIYLKLGYTEEQARAGEICGMVFVKYN